MRWGIVLTGAIIGTVIFPVVGTMIGALIGCVIGASSEKSPSPVAIKTVKNVVIECLPPEIAENNPTFGEHNYINPDVLGYLKVNGLNVEVSTRVVLVKIHPADVVAIPRDYGVAKGRCCRMEVLSECPKADVDEYFKDSLVYNEPEALDEDDYDVDFDDYDNDFDFEVGQIWAPRNDLTAARSSAHKKPPEYDRADMHETV